MKKIFAAVIAAAALFPFCAAAQETGMAAAPVEGNATATDWFVTIDYNGYEFEIPAGCLVEKGPTVVAKYPDGTFGVSMSNVESIGTSQRNCIEVCKRLVKQLKLKDAKIENKKVGKVEGAKATGEFDGTLVTILILPYDDQETTAIIMAAPGRQAWADHLVETMRH